MPILLPIGDEAEAGAEGAGAVEETLGSDE
jgi:hypothetical protein